MTQTLFDKYFIEDNGLWKEHLDEVKEKGFENASSIARLIYSCEIGSGIDQHASEDLKAVSSYMMAQAAELATLRAVVEAARGALVAYPRAGTKLSDAMLVLYDALAAYDKK